MHCRKCNGYMEPLFQLGAGEFERRILVCRHGEVGALRDDGVGHDIVYIEEHFEDGEWKVSDLRYMGNNTLGKGGE